MTNDKGIKNTILAFREIVKEHNITIPDAVMPKKPILKLLQFFASIDDARFQAKVSYPLCELLMVAFIAIIAGAATMVDIASFASDNEQWLAKNFKIKHGAASHDTFRRVLSIIDPVHLQTATVAFLIDSIKLIKKAFNIEEGKKQYCVDGKTARGTGRLKGLPREVRQMHTLHVYDRSDGICIISKEVGEKTNEIPVAQEVLKMLDLKDAVVSFDALNTQRETVSAVIGQKGDYVAALKGNQSDLYQEAVSFFTPTLLKRIATGGANYYEVKDKQHNRIEVRKYYLSKNVSWLVQQSEWAGLKSLVYYTIHTEDINSGKITDEAYCYISSLKDVRLCADVIRGHWSVENQLHWHLDVNFLEDSTEIIDRTAFQNFSLLNKMALSLLKLISPLVQSSVRTTKKRLGWKIDLLIDAFRAVDEDVLDSLQLVKKNP